MDDSTTWIRIDVVHDAVAGVWIATNDDLPFATEAGTYEELVERAQIAALEILAERAAMGADVPTMPHHICFTNNVTLSANAG